MFEETDFARYMDSWPDIAVNTVMQVGHNTLRLMAMGMENRAPREAELRHMQDMLTEGLEAGALGRLPACSPRRAASASATSCAPWVAS